MQALELVLRPEHEADILVCVSHEGETPLTLEAVERVQIERALRHHGGNRTRAAQELGISRATLINKIKTYALDL